MSTESDQIESNALGPKKVQVDGQIVEQHPVADQIAAVRFGQSEAARSSKKFGIRYGQFRNQGTTRGTT